MRQKTFTSILETKKYLLNEPDSSLNNQIQIHLLGPSEPFSHELLLHCQPGVLLLQLLQLSHHGLLLVLQLLSVLATSVNKSLWLLCCIMM